MAQQEFPGLAMSRPQKHMTTTLGYPIGISRSALTNDLNLTEDNYDMIKMNFSTMRTCGRA